MTLPRNVAGRRRLQPYSRADAPFFRSPGFFVRIGGLAVVVGIALCILLLRAWSIQILHGPQYTSLANGQAYRTVDLVGPRGAIVDDKGRKLAGTTGRIVVAAHARPDGGAIVTVTDDGPGIPRELRTRIFEPGFSTKQSGWGIGLSLARRIVEESHGGTLRLAAIDRGASFEIILP